MKVLSKFCILAAAGVSAQLVVDLQTDQTPEEALEANAATHVHTPVQTGIVSTAAGGDGLCDPNVQQHSGYIPFTDADGQEKSYFFWMFESRTQHTTDPLVLWLTGGPGCSSSLALLAENGPCTVNDDGKSTTENKYSWTQRANMIWVDQPAGTGFSEGMWDHDEDGVAEDMYAFLITFFQKFPEYSKLPFYITGESYAGHYIPAVAHKIWEMNKTAQAKIQLKGIAIGNGLTNTEVQYAWYPQMAFDGGKGEGGSLEKGVVTNAFAQTVMKAAVKPCVAQIQACNAGDNKACLQAFMVCNYGETVPYQLTGYNPYDMRIKCEEPPLCYDFSKVASYLNNSDVQAKLGVKEGTKWRSCNLGVNTVFKLDFMRSYHQLIPDLLADNIPVLIYAGDVDYICNWLGNKHWTMELEWPHQAEYAAADDKPFMVEKKEAGRVRTAHNFAFAQIYSAGHMVPMDQPNVALEMLGDFLDGKIFSGKEAEKGTEAKKAMASSDEEIIHV